jgi:predicted RNA binding protein YcfA (HicA-like mRNA interferase family)
MKSLSGKELAKLLEKNGWQLLRIQGSHHIYGKPNNIVRLSVPIHGNQLSNEVFFIIYSKWPVLIQRLSND